MHSIVLLLALAQDPSLPSSTVDLEPKTESKSPGVPAKKKKKAQADQEPGPLQEDPDRPKPTLKARDHGQEPTFSARVGLEAEYSSNILRLSPHDVDRLENGTNSEKFRITQPDDFIYSPWVEGTLHFRMLDRPTSAGLRVEPHFYETNTVASYQDITLFLKQKAWDVSYTFEPDVYRREYRNLDTGEFESAFYADHLLEGTAKVHALDWLIVRPRAGIEFRDYDSPFNHRDSVFLTLSPRVVAKATEWLEFSLGYDFVYNSAFATDFQPDTSYIQNGIEPGVAVRPWDPFEVEARYKFASREYTTRNSPAVDPTHRGRFEERNSFQLRARWKVSPSFSVHAAYEYTYVNSDYPFDPSKADDETSWQRDQVTIGVLYQF
jgi:hypothetical protein